MASTEVDLVVNEPITAGQWYVVWAFPADSTSANFRSITLAQEWSAFPFLDSVGGVTTANAFIDTPSAMASAATTPTTSDYRLIDITFEIPGIELSQLTSVNCANVSIKPAVL